MRVAGKPEYARLCELVSPRSREGSRVGPTLPTVAAIRAELMQQRRDRYDDRYTDFFFRNGVFIYSFVCVTCMTVVYLSICPTDKRAKFDDDDDAPI